MTTTIKSARAKKKQKSSPQKKEIRVGVVDQLDSAIATVQTVQDAIGRDDHAHLAIVLLEHALQPLLEIKRKFEEAARWALRQPLPSIRRKRRTARAKSRAR